ncbi:MAG: flippase-like domain-containing protein [Bacteroidia bacterium]|nr:flippase-like domain-containing protein [Bacteroidia bacterium]MDW8236188.1 lysylphosphatidylglycerol synthase transmembrane domain-containing protein [Bacteroidia bacterium]
MKRRLIEATLGLILGAALFYWVLRDFDWRSLNRLSPPMLIAAAIAMSAAHFLRAWRWYLVLRHKGSALSLASAWHAVILGYALNLVLPRAGELARCTLLTRWHGVPFPTGLGSVVAERIVDILILLTLTGGLVLLRGMDWLEILGLTAYLPYLIGLGIIGGLVAWGLWRFWLAKKGLTLLRQAIEGFTAILETKPQSWIWASSLLIWVGYWAAIVGVMLAAPLNFSLLFILTSAWVMLVGSGLAMALPVPGGLGTFHAIGLALLSVSGWIPEPARLIVVAAHALQTLLVLVLAVPSLFFMLHYQRYRPVSPINRLSSK